MTRSSETMMWLDSSGLRPYTSGSVIVPPPPDPIPGINDPHARIIVSQQNGLDVVVSAGTSTAGASGALLIGFLWDFGDSTGATGIGVGHSYAAPGTYTIRLTVNDEIGGTSSTTQQITVASVVTPVDQPPVAAFTATVNGQTLTADGSGSVDPDSDPLTFTWTFGDGGSAVGSPTTHVYSLSGTYVVALTVTDPSGLASTTTQTVTVSALTSVITLVSTAALTASFSAANSTSGNTITGYDWDWGDGTAHGTGVSASHSYAAGGAHPVTLTVSDSSGATASATTTVTVTAGIPYDWSASNLPWAYTDPAVFTASWPTGYTVVDLNSATGNFVSDLTSTVSKAGKRVVVRLPAGTFHIKSFIPVGSSGDPTYAFGFYIPNLQGLLGAGPDQTFVQMDANSMSSAQITALQQKTQASFAPNAMGICRIDSQSGSPLLLAGITFQAADQQNITSTGDTFNPAIALPQSAPHQGVVLYTNTVGLSGYVSYVRFQGAGRALMSQPPFEHANVTSQHMKVYWNNVELDGRRSPAINAAQPRRCGVWMGNNETLSQFQDSWLHHSNVSRYAANDQNGGGNGGISTSYGKGAYSLTRCKIEQVSNTNNDGNGGYTNATPLGWESSAADITLDSCIVSRDNPYTSSQYPAHLQLTDVGGVSRDGGTMTVKNCIFRDSVYPTMNGFLIFRIVTSATYWYDSGNFSQVSIYGPTGALLQPVRLSSFSPANPRALTAAQAAAYDPAKHYFVETA